MQIIKDNMSMRRTENFSRISNFLEQNVHIHQHTVNIEYSMKSMGNLYNKTLVPCLHGLRYLYLPCPFLSSHKQV